MSSWKQMKRLRSGIGIGSAALVAVLLAGACNRKDSSSAPKATAEAAPSHRTADTPVVQPSARQTTAGAKEAARQPAVAEPVKSPASNGTSAGCEPAPASSEEYAARLEARRSLLHDYRHRGQIDEAVAALAGLLNDVEQREGTAMAKRVALAEAGNLAAQKDYATAVKTYELALCRYPQAAFAAEAAYSLGDCRLELHDYAAAERVWRKLIDEHGDSTLAPWAWRRLALVQLLQAHYDQSLATLEAMAAKYAGTEYEEYARVRRGYVLAAAGQVQEARSAYRAFLKEFPRSKYCGLAGQQMAELEAGVALAKTAR